MGMAAELREAPDAVRRQADRSGRAAGRARRAAAAPAAAVVVTCARGSSAHAATFAKHLIELYLGIPVAAAAPNIASVYRRTLRLDGQLFLAVSQSGRSDDLVANAAMARAGRRADRGAGQRRGQPAGRGVRHRAADLRRPGAQRRRDKDRLSPASPRCCGWSPTGPRTATSPAALERLPERLASAGELDWSAAIDPLAAASSLVVIGRGPTLAIAREAALKLKEVANLHAEAFSGAEFLHGPVALVAARYPILVLMPTDAAGDGYAGAGPPTSRGKGAALFAAGAGRRAAGARPRPSRDRRDLPDPELLCDDCSRLAARLGIDPDRPRHLQKVTRTR